MKSNRKVFVWGATYTNKGSEAMFFTLQQLIQSELVMAADYESDMLNADKKVTHVRAPSGALAYILFFFEAMLYRLTSLCSSKNRELFKELKSAYSVVDLSGFALSEDFSKNSCTYRSSVYLIQAVVSKVIFGKKYEIFPQAIGPIERGFNKFLLSLILKISDKVFVRGKRSFAFAKKYKSKNIEMTTDLVFLLEHEKYLVNDSVWNGKDKYVVINPNSRIYHKQLKSNKSDYIESLRMQIDRCLSEGYEVVLTPNELRENEFDDLDVCRVIFDSFYKQESKVLVNEDVEISNLFNLVANAELCILSRFHLMIFALMCETPCLIASWSDKYLDIMEDFHLENYCTSNYDLVMEKLELMFKDLSEIRTSITTNLTSVNNQLVVVKEHINENYYNS